MKVFLQVLFLAIFDLVHAVPPERLFHVLCVVIVEDLLDLTIVLLHDDHQHAQVLKELSQLYVQNHHLSDNDTKLLITSKSKVQRVAHGCISLIAFHEILAEQHFSIVYKKFEVNDKEVEKVNDDQPLALLQQFEAENAVSFVVTRLPIFLAWSDHLLSHCFVTVIERNQAEVEE